MTNEMYLVVMVSVTVGILSVNLYYNKNDHVLLKEQKPILSGMDGTLQCVYMEVLELHKKIRGLFKVLRPHTRLSAPLLFPNGSRSMMEELSFFHDGLIGFLISVTLGILGTLYVIKISNCRHREMCDSQVVESVWTIIPLFLIFIIALPSLKLLYLVDEIGRVGLTVKAIGHQWYWEYDYPDFPPFDSYIITGSLRLLDADRRLICPIRQPVQLLVSAADVLHSWTVPSIGVKADAVPGRVNKLSLMSKRAGVFFGQCSEICGRNHRFIPITIECYDIECVGAKQQCMLLFNYLSLWKWLIIKLRF